MRKPYFAQKRGRGADIAPSDKKSQKSVTVRKFVTVRK